MADIATLYIEVDSKGYVKASKNAKEFTAEQKKVVKATQRASDSVTGFNKKQKGMNISLAEASSGLKTVGRDINRYSILMAGAATAVTKFSFDLSEGLGQVQTLIPNTGDRIFELEEAVKSLSVETGVSFNNLTAGLYQTISAFQDSADTIDIFNQATKASIAGAATVSDSIALASAVTKAYGDTTAEATQKVFDLAFETVRLGQTTFPELANGIQTATDSAVRLGVSQEELFATFASLTGVIGDASEVATKFRSASASLLNPNAKLTDLFKRLAEATGEQVKTGEEFVKVSGGWANALKLIIDTAADSDEPFQKYIRRIEGITLASRISGSSLNKYQSDLQAMYDAVGASERSFNEAINGIDKFRREMLKSRQEIIVAATEIGANLIPRLIDLVQFISGAVTWFSKLDSELQNTIFTFGGFLAVLGPALIALGSLARAIKGIQALMATKFVASMLASSVATGGLGLALVGLVAGLFALNRAVTKSIEDQKRLTSALERQESVMHKLPAAMDEWRKVTDELNESNELNRETNLTLLRLYPELASKVDILTVSEEKLAKAIREVDEVRARSDLASQFKDARVAISDYLRAVDLGNTRLTQLEQIQQKIAEGEVMAGAGRRRGLGDYAQQLEMVQSQLNKTAISIRGLNEDQKAAIDELNDYLATYGFEAYADASTNWEIALRDILQITKNGTEEINNVIDSLGDLGGKPAERLKTWEEWFSELSDVALERFNQLQLKFDAEGGIDPSSILGDGKKAAEEFIKDLEASLDRELDLGALIGEDTFSIQQEGFGDMISESKELILALEAIRAEEIANGEVFTNTDNAIRTQIESIKRWKEELKKFQEIDFKSSLYGNIDAIDAFNTVMGESGDNFDTLSDKADLLKEAIKKALAEGFDTTSMESELKVIEGQLSHTFEGAKNLVRDFNNGISEGLFDAIDSLGVFGAEANVILAGLGTQLANMGVDAVADSFYALGEAMASSADAGKDFEQAMLGVLKSILDALPSLFIQAGLQMIINGNWALGLGLVAAGLTGKIIGGFVNKTIAEGEADARATTSNAHGNIYPKTFAKGGAPLGSFENSIVNTPTLFNSGAGLMGERGEEAIMPLTRTSSGDLGVQAVGGNSAPVYVTVINNTNSQVSQRETTNADGSREIEIMVGKMINSAISSGRTDKAMAGAYGIQRKGRN